MKAASDHPLLHSVKAVVSWVAERWDRFFFEPSLPATVAVIRIVCGAMLFYSHLVWTFGLDAWLGPNAWIDAELSRQLQDGTLGEATSVWSHLWFVQSPTLLYLHQFFVLLITGCFAAGLATRITAPLAWFFQLMAIHRLIGAQFGLDQITLYAAMYLMLTPCGSAYSVDHWIRSRGWFGSDRSRFGNWMFPEAGESSATTLGTRLLQIHLCVMYLFGGLSKVRGTSWWDGTAVWYSVSNAEYQSLDMTWLADWPWLFSAMSHVTMFWELFYIALIWPRASRPFVLAMAVMVHGGIALFLGMFTFGAMMIAANLAFVPPRFLMPGGWKQIAEASRNARARRDLQSQWDELHRRKAKLKEREKIYRGRVDRLKRREAKIKDAYERRQAAKATDTGDDRSEL